MARSDLLSICESVGHGGPNAAAGGLGPLELGGGAARTMRATAAAVGPGGSGWGGYYILEKQILK